MNKNIVIALIIPVVMALNFVVYAARLGLAPAQFTVLMFTALVLNLTLALAVMLTMRPLAARDNHAVWLTALAMLTEGEGWSVEFLCPNPEASSKDTEYAIVCRGEWTCWKEKRFLSRRHDFAMRDAVVALCRWKDAREALLSRDITL